MAKWKISSKDSREAVTALVTNTGMSRVDLAEKCHISANTIWRYLTGKPVEEKMLQNLFGYLLFQTPEKLTRQQLPAVKDAIKEYSKPAQEEQGMKTKPDAAPPLAVMAVYVKFLHLRDRRSAAPVYRKWMARLGQEVEVFDELLFLRTLLFHGTPAPFEVVGQRPEFNDLQPIFPPRVELTPLYLGRHERPSVVEHYETEPAPLWQGAFTVVNGFQRGQEFIGSLLTEDCARLVLVADLSSLPIRAEQLLAGPPVGLHLRVTAAGEERRHMLVEESAKGAFILDTGKAGAGSGMEAGWNPEQDRLLKNDRYEIRFSVNWEALA